MRDKTVLLPISQGFMARYFLQTDIFPTLQEAGCRIVLLVPNPDDAYWQEFAKHDNVVLAHYREDLCRQYLREHRGERLLKQLRFNTLNGWRDIQTCNDLYLAQMGDVRKKMSTPVYLLYRMIYGSIVWTARHCRPVRSLISWLEHGRYAPAFHSEVFEEYSPDLVLSSSLGTFDFDQYVMREARKRGVKTLAVILSWDNTTCRGYPGAVPDRVITWTEVMRRELEELNDISASRAFAGGVAHYDHYYRDETFFSREELCSRLKLDPAKEILFVVTKSPNGYAWNSDVSEALLAASRDGKFAEKCQVLVRLHPLYYRVIDGEQRFQYFLDKFTELERKYPELVLNQPVIQSEGMNYSMPRDEIRLLASMLKHSSVVVNMFSSINIEASIFDTPTVNVCFEGTSYDGPMKGRYNIVMDSVQTHNRRIVESGGTRVAHSPVELVEHVNAYLKDPALDAEGRRKIVDVEAGPHRGEAGRRIAEHILSRL